MANGRASRGFPWGFALLMVLALPLYALMATSAAGSRASDAAGNGMAAAFGVFFLLALWIVLSIALLVARPHGAIPGWATASLIVLLPLSAIGIAISIGVWSDGGGWLIALPIATPLLLAVYATWARLPGLHGLLPIDPANAVIVAVLVVATAAPFVTMAF